MRGMISYIQHKIGERNYIMLCDPSSPLSEIKDAIFHFNIEVADAEKFAMEQQAQAQAEQPVVEEIIPEVQVDPVQEC